MRDVIEFYADYDEDGRLLRHPTEFMTTTYLLDALIEPNSSILDVAAGTGRYALHYAQQGHQVTAMDLVPRHIAIAREKIASRHLTSVEAFVGDARDLSRFDDGRFDVVLSMGPMYHLPSADIYVAITECMRVLRHRGLVVVSYVNTYPGHADDECFDAFLFRSPTEIQGLLEPFSLDMVHHVATDGPIFEELEAIVARCPNNRHPHLAWLARHKFIFEESLGLDTCRHALYIGRKV